MSADGQSIGILLSGRGSNFCAIADRIAKGDLKAHIDVVVSDKADARGLQAAREHHLATVFVDPKAHASRAEFDHAVGRILQDHAVDLVCLAGYMRILSPDFIRLFQGRILNIHPALLPAFPGLHAQRQALEHGVKVSGCTVHFVDDGVDTGPIVLQEAVPVLDDDTEEALSKRILAREHDLYWRAIDLVLSKKIAIEGHRTTHR